jgi:hypothetical protein
MSETEFVKIDTFFHATEAQTAKSVLELAGIGSVLVDEGMEGLIGVTPGGVILKVRAVDADRAREILDRGSLGPAVDANEMAGGSSSGE